MNIIDKLIYFYSTDKIQEFNQTLNKENNKEIIIQLIKQFINDKNSSTARERTILYECNYQPLLSKLGYDGQNEEGFCEVKLSNCDTSKQKPEKLNGSGSYSDYTWDRYHKHLKENPTLLIGGFIDGKLIYIFKIKYDSPKLKTHFYNKLYNYFGDSHLLRKPNHYLRSLQFNYKSYIDDAELIYIASKTKLEYYKSYIVKDLYERLLSECK